MIHFLRNLNSRRLRRVVRRRGKNIRTYRGGAPRDFAWNAPLIRRAPLICLFVLATLCSGQTLSAQEEIGVPRSNASESDAAQVAEDAAKDALLGESEDGLAFRRVFVPADRSDLWPRDGQRYLPIDRAEFKRLVELARRSGRPAGGGRVERAIYQARLQGDSLLEGQAELTIEKADAPTSVVPLDACNLEIHAPVWQDGSNDDAILGVTAGAGTGLLVDRSAAVSFTWSADAEQDKQEGRVFHLRWPPSVSKQLALRLPPGKTPAVDSGVVTDRGETEDGNVLWKIELGAHAETTLRILNSPSASDPAACVAASERIHYSLAARRLELTADFTFTPIVRSDGMTAARRLFFDVDPELTVVSIHSGGADLVWSYVSSSPDSVEVGAGDSTTEDGMAPAAAGSRRRMVIDLPSPLEAGRRVEFTAVAPLVTRSMWRLPGVSPWRVLWTDGSAKLSIPADVHLESLDVDGGRQIAVPRSEQLKGEETIGVEFFAQDAGISIQASDRADTLESNRSLGVRQHRAMTFSLSPREIRGVATALIESAERPVFEISGVVDRRWSIESVATLPSEALAEWLLEEQEDRGRRLTIRLAEPASARRDVRLVITGSLHEPVLTHDDLSFVRFDYPDSSRPLVLVRGAAPNSSRRRLQVTGTAQLTQINPASLEPNERDLFSNRNNSASLDNGLLFAINSRVRDLRIELADRTPRFAGEIRINAVAAGEELSETATFRCTPQSGSLTTSLVRFSNASNETRSTKSDMAPEGGSRSKLADADSPVEEGDGESEWTFYDVAGRTLSARRLTSAEAQRLGAVGRNRVWEVMHRQPHDTPFEFRAKRTVSRTTPAAITLASLPGATRQTGDVKVRLKGTPDVQLVNRGLLPLPASKDDTGSDGILVGAFQFDPERDLMASSSAPLVLASPPEGQSQPAAWIWSEHTQARYAPDGVVTYVLSMAIENRGERLIEIDLPSGSQIQGVWRDGQRLLVGQTATDGRSQDAERRHKIPLDSEKRFSRVTLRYLVQQSPLRTFRSIEFQQAASRFPVAHRDCTVYLPPNFAAPHMADASPTPARSWSSRLFGPLGRAPGERPFAPLRPADWRRMILREEGDAESLSFAQRILERCAASYESDDTQLSPGSRATESARPRTWGELFSRFPARSKVESGSQTQARPALYLDIGALAQAGVLPSKGLPEIPLFALGSGDFCQRGNDLLQSADLVLWSHRDAVLLTTSEQTSRARRQLRPTAYSSLYQVADESLSTALSFALSDPDSARIVPVELWNQAAVRSPASWSAESFGFQEPVGWNAYYLERPLRPNGHATFHVVYNPTVRFLGVLAFLLMTTVSRPVFEQSMFGYLATLCVVAILALISPAMFVPLATGLVLGALAGPVVHLALQWSTRFRSRRPSLAEGSTVLAPAQVAGTLLLAFTVGLADTAIAQAPLNRPANEALRAAKSKETAASQTSEDAAAIEETSKQPASSDPRIVTAAGQAVSATGKRRPHVPNRPSGETPQNDREKSASAPVRLLSKVLIPINPNRIDPSRIDPSRIEADGPASLHPPRASELKPVGDQVYVSEEFFGLLHRMAKQAERRQGDWAITDAVYRIELSDQGDLEPMRLDRFQAELTLHTFVRSVWANIPLAAPDGSWSEGAVRIDGRPARWRLADDGKSIFVAIEEPGPYRITLSPTPPVEVRRRRAVLSLAIPPVPSARVEVVAPADAPLVEVSDSIGLLPSRARPGTRVARLGPTSELHVQWPAKSAAENEDLGDVEELLWMRVKPAVVELTARFVISRPTGRHDPLILEVDPAWSLLAPSEDSIVRQAIPLTNEQTPDRSSLYQLELRDSPQERPQERVVVELRLLLRQTSSVGVFDVPEIRLRKAASRTRLLAVDVDSALRYDAPVSVEEGFITSSDFVDAWRATTPENAHAAVPQPALAYRLADSMPTWNLVTQPRTPKTSSRDRTTLNVGDTSVALTYETEIQISGWQRFQFCVACPPSVAVDSVSIYDGETDSSATSRWRRLFAGDVTVFVQRPARSSVRIVLHGSIPIPPDGRLEVPSLSEQESRPASRQLVVLRQPTARVQVQAPMASRPLDRESLWQDGAFSAAGAGGRLVEALELPAGDAHVVCLVHANQPRVDGRQVTWVERTTSGWRASVEFFLRIDEGIVDELLLEIPAWWEGPFEVSPASDVEIEAFADSRQTAFEDAGARRVRIRPKTALTGEVQVKLQAALPPQHDNSVQAPNVRLISGRVRQRFLALPNRADSREFAWDTHGLRSARLPEDFAPPTDLRKNFDIYAVAIPQFQARPRPVENFDLAPRVRLADIRVLAGRQSGDVGVATYDLEPGSLAACELRLPAGNRLLRASVAGLPALLRPIDESKQGAAGETSDSGGTLWRVQLGPRGLPQRIEVVYAREIPPERKAASEEFQAPLLQSASRNIPTDQTLWTVFVEDTGSRPITQTDLIQVSRNQAEARRQAIVDLLRLGANQAERFTSDQRASWFARWRQRLRQLPGSEFQPPAGGFQAPAQQAGSNASNGSGGEPGGKAGREGNDDLSKALNTIAAKLGIEMKTDQIKDSLIADDLSETNPPSALLRTSYHGILPTVCYVFPETVDRLEIQFQSPYHHERQTRLLAAGLLAVLVACLAFASRRKILDLEVLRRWPHAWALAVGLAWWLWLTPSVCGVLIVAATLVALLWRRVGGGRRLPVPFVRPSSRP